MATWKINLDCPIGPVAVIEMVFFKSYPPNEYGHDFVVGDIHGHGQCLLNELARQGFDKEKDRLFCTGDLIDRGPDSFGTLTLVFEPWFHFARGNHEDDLPLFLEYQYPKSNDDRAWNSDTAWVYHLHEEQIHYLREKMLPVLSAAPIVLRVEGAHGFWVVHADRGVFGRHDGPLKLLDDKQLPLVDENDLNQVEAMLWSRRLLREIPHADLRDYGLYRAASGQELAPNVGFTFVGHSVVERPTLFRSHLFIDTGMGTIPDGQLTVLRVRDVLRVTRVCLPY